MVAVPAAFVDLLREVLIGKLVNCAGEIADSGDAHPSDGIEEELLEEFEKWRALQVQVGCVRECPAGRVEVELGNSRRALVGALRGRLEFEQDLMDVDRSEPAGVKQRDATRATKAAGAQAAQRDGHHQLPRHPLLNGQQQWSPRRGAGAARQAWSRVGHHATAQEQA